LDVGEFIGRQALLQKKAGGIKQRLHTLVIGGDDYLTLYGGEAVICGGNVISRLRSAGYGYTVRKNIGFAYLPVDMVPEKTKLEVDIFGETVAAEIAPDVLYDPTGAALK
jgi:glycine cleavage system aminomethyltransferase T